MLQSILFKFHAFLLGILLLSFFVFSMWLNNQVLLAQVERSENIVAQDIQMHARQTLTPESFSYVGENQAPAGLSQFIKEIRTSDIIRINIWDKDSRVIFSDYPPIIGKKFPEDEGMRLALNGKIQANIEEPNSAEREGINGYDQFLEIYIPVYFKGDTEPAGVIEAYLNMNDTFALISKIRLSIVIGSLTVIAFIFAIEWIMFWQLVRRRLALLIEAAREVAGGNMDVQVNIKGHDEIGEYANIFNFMASKLKDAHDGMEQKIKERIEKLERDNKQMIGREIKMVELKKELDELKSTMRDDHGGQKND